MYAWEREALGIDTLGELAAGRRVSLRLDLTEEGPSRGWIPALYGPEVWNTWRVGLVRRSLGAESDEPIELPEPLVLHLPADVAQRTAGVAERWDTIAMSPAILDERALVFVTTGTRDETDETGVRRASRRWEIVAPTDIRERLGLVDGQVVAVRLLSGGTRPRATHEARR